MKSPYQNSWMPLKIYAIGGMIMALCYLALTSLLLGSTTISAKQIYGSLLIECLFLSIGVFLSLTYKEYLHRTVNNPVDPRNLIINKRYWLNGETWATYLGQDEYTGRYKFRIWGINKSMDPSKEDATLLLPGQVREYISEEQEVFELTA